jgi:hypothetical protein
MTSPGPRSGKSTLISSIARVYRHADRVWVDEGYDLLASPSLKGKRDGLMERLKLYESIGDIVSARETFSEYMLSRLDPIDQLYERFRRFISAHPRNQTIYGFIDTAGVACLASVAARNRVNDFLRDYPELKDSLEYEASVTLGTEVVDVVRAYLFSYMDSMRQAMLRSGNRILVLDLPVRILRERSLVDHRRSEVRNPHLDDAQALRLIDLVLADILPETAVVVKGAVSTHLNQAVHIKTPLQLASSALIADMLSVIRVNMKWGPAHNNSDLSKLISMRLTELLVYHKILRLQGSM